MIGKFGGYQGTSGGGPVGPPPSGGSSGRPAFGKKAITSASEDERKAVGDVDRALSQLNIAIGRASNLGISIEISELTHTVIGQPPQKMFRRDRCVKTHEIEPL
jgi:hypothetical protein